MSSAQDRGDYSEGFQQMCYWILVFHIVDQETLEEHLSGVLPYHEGPGYFEKGARAAMKQLLGMMQNAYRYRKMVADALKDGYVEWDFTGCKTMEEVDHFVDISGTDAAMERPKR